MSDNRWFSQGKFLIIKDCLWMGLLRVGFGGVCQYAGSVGESRESGSVYPCVFG